MRLFTALRFPVTNSEATRYNVRRDDHRPYLNQFLRAFAPVRHITERAPVAPRVTSPALAEPLTARELEVRA